MEGQDDSKVIGKINRLRKMIFMPILEEGVYRFDCGVDARKDAFPSLSFLDPKARDSPLEDYMHKVPDYIPFCESLHGQQVVTIELPHGSSLYGTGEVSGSFERTGKKVFAWNTTAWGYGPGTTSLYQSHPWVLAILPNGESYGVLADTTRRCEIDLRRDSTIKFVAPAAYPVITFGPVVSATAVLTSLCHAIDTQWLHSRVEIGGYEEYSGVEYQSVGCSEKYTLIKRDLQQPEEQESMALEGDIGGGLVLQREISVSKSRPKVVCIESSIIAKHVGDGSGGFSRLVCLRVHPTFTLVHPMEVCIKFTSVDGTDYEISPEIGENLLQANARPNGEWMLVDKCAGLALVNRFNVNEVAQCLIHWDTGTCNLELWSEERPVSKDTPLRISHEYEVIKYHSP